VKNNIIRQSKRLSGEHNNFFEYENKKNANIVQQNKKIKIDLEDIETLEKLESEKLINKKIDNIMRSNNKKQNQNIKFNNYKKMYNTNVDKNNANNNNNINKFNNNNSRRDKDDDELSQLSQESEGSHADKRFLKNRLLIYDDIVVTYNRLNHDDEKSLLDKQKTFVEPYPATKQKSFVEPFSVTKQNSFVELFPITNTNPFNTTVADNVTVNNISESAKIDNMVTSKNLDEQQRHTAIKKFMATENSSASMYWEEDSTSTNKNINISL
jgi:hypothetical protein